MASVGVSFALGFGMAWYLKPAELQPALARVQPAAATPASTLNPFTPPAAGTPPVTSAPALADNASVDALWDRALMPPGQQSAGYDAEDRLRKLAQANPVALRSLLQRYDSAHTPQARELLKSILSTIQRPEVIAFSARLANSSTLADRKFGFEMLQGVAPDAPETRAMVRHTLANEQSPEVLVQALAALKLGAADPDEAEQVVAQLKTLSQHADPAVRSQSIAQLGQWDKKGEGELRLTQALADRVPEVRQAAIFALAQSGTRSEPVKAALLGLLTNAQESRDLRGSALQVLERFPLSKDEYAGFAKARAQLQGP